MWLVTRSESSPKASVESEHAISGAGSHRQGEPAATDCLKGEEKVWMASFQTAAADYWYNTALPGVWLCAIFSPLFLVNMRLQLWLL